MSWRREARQIVGGALNVLAARLRNRGDRAPRVEPLAIEPYLALGAPTPVDTAGLLAGRANVDRAAVLETVLRARGIVFSRQVYGTPAAGGVNLLADVGDGPRILLLAAHHDVVPGSPGANDNAAAVGILLALRERLRLAPPRRLTVRLAFFGDEERGMRGSRAYVRAADVGALFGMVSLELCGIGDGLALWDVTPGLERTELVQAWIAAAEGLGYERDRTHHLAAPVPLFGSDHRSFADRIPAVGLTAVPTAAAEALRAFIYGGVRSALVPAARRPPPFTTYHTPADCPETLDPEACARVVTVLEALCRRLD